MKQTVKQVLALALCLLLLVTVVAGCDPQEDNGGSTTKSTTTTNNGDVTDPSGDVTDPSGDVTDPSGDVTDPSGDVTDPSGDVTDPSGDVTDPSGDVTDPSQGTTKPSDKTTKPTNTTKTNATTTNKPVQGGATVQVGNLTVHQTGEPYVSGGKLAVSTMLPYNPGDIATNHDANKQAFAKYYEEKSGMKLDYMYYARPDIFVLKATMLNSGNVPDLFISVGVGFKGSEVATYGKQGFFKDLTPLLEKWAPNALAKLNDKNYSYVKTATYAPGKVYALPDLNNVENAKGRVPEYQPAINIAWLDELGLEIPKTMDEFYEVCKAFTEEDPDGNGKNDTFGFGAPLWMPQLWNAWGLGMDYYTHGAITEKGEVVYGPITDQFREGCRFFNRMWEEGLMAKQMFNCSEAAFKSLVAKTGIVPLGTADTGLQEALTDSELKNWQVIAWPTGNNLGDMKPGTSASADSYGTPNVFFIGKNAKSPEAILRWLDYFYTDDGAMLWSYGPEGKAYTKIGGKYKLLKNANELAKDQKLWCSGQPMEPHNVMTRSKSEMSVREQFGARTSEEAKKTTKRTTYNFYWLDNLKSESEAAALEKLTTPGDWNWGIQAIRGDVDIETEWNNYKNQFSKDYAQWKKIYQGVFDRYFK